MKFTFDSKEQEKKDIALASAKVQAWIQNIICRRNSTMVSKDVHYKFAYTKIQRTGKFMATITVDNIKYTLVAYTKKGLKYLFAEFIEYMYAQIADSEDVERVEYSHNVQESTDVQSIDELYFKFRTVAKDNNRNYLYCIVTGNNDIQEFLIASTGNNSKCFVTHVNQLLHIIKKIDIFYISNMCYNAILGKLWDEITHWIQTSHNTISLYDSNKQQVVSLLEFKRLDVLFIEYFINSKDVEITALFPQLLTPNGHVQSYSHTGQHSEAHTDLLHCKHSEFNEYRELLKELIELGYNLKVLNRN